MRFAYRLKQGLCVMASYCCGMSAVGHASASCADVPAVLMFWQPVCWPCAVQGGAASGGHVSDCSLLACLPKTAF